ncbi:integral membrane protein [Jimgerdemannia flammicorona]|uniref:Integral membrane protein n=1 Tax=Jimgerdemannia flammicorona TaxID=994334 RepID=A0A433R0E6_9FUNG|nr:integral membrane protein [Jimgerdemannia flammicorona]
MIARSAPRVPQILLHLAGMASFSYSFWTLAHMTNKASASFGWHFQLEGLISILYWSLLYYDERLLKHPDVAALPIIVDLSFHLFPAVLLWADFLFFSRQFARSARHITYIFVFGAAYCVWTHLCFQQNGFWPYPILEKLPTPYRIAFFVACAAFCTLVYEFGARLHRFFNKPLETLTKKIQ